jgi:hypothetical protein
MRRLRHWRPLCGLLLLAVVVVPQTGCVGFAANLIYMIKGNNVEARCTALEGKRVAVVCVSGPGAGPREESEKLAWAVGALLKQNVKKIDLVRPEEVADWRDQNNWDQIDYKSIGRGVKADMVVAIDLSTFSIHDDKTLLRGRAKVKTTVYNLTDKSKKGDSIAWAEDQKEFVFPQNGGQQVTENEVNFQRIYLSMLAKDIAKNFYDYPKIDDVAQDSPMAN